MCRPVLCGASCVCEDNHRLIQAQALSQNPAATWDFNNTLVGVVFFGFFSSTICMYRSASSLLGVSFLQCRTDVYIFKRVDNV